MLETVTLLFFGFFVFRLIHFWKQDAKLPVLDRHTNQPPIYPINRLVFLSYIESVFVFPMYDSVPIVPLTFVDWSRNESDHELGTVIIVTFWICCQ